MLLVPREKCEKKSNNSDTKSNECFPHNNLNLFFETTFSWNLIELDENEKHASLLYYNILYFH
jgi:hypothetical protein